MHAHIQPALLSHGTLECRDLEASRRFYQEVLGMETVRTGPMSMNIRLGGAWVIVVLQVGDAVKPSSQGRHYGLDMRSPEEVDQAYAKIQEIQNEYGIQKITKPRSQHGVYSFYITDLDYNWWEYQYAPDNFYDRVFKSGDLQGLGVHDRSMNPV
jgi:catechol 2,3-dioxygenase-like lactoylglutathione lyase family enzyme